MPNLVNLVPKIGSTGTLHLWYGGGGGPNNLAAAPHA